MSVHQKNIQKHAANIINGGIDGVIHLKKVFDCTLVSQAKLLIETLNFVPQKENNKIARYESFAVPLDNPCVNSIRDLLFQVKNELGFHKDLSFETYAFKYETGNKIPKHKDRDRHKITAIAYFGDFTGGEYVYWPNGSEEGICIKPNCGDVLISVNETSNGEVLNPVHCVNEIIAGIRFCIVGSLVNANASDKIFS